jgi:hypothetical protein
METLDMLARYCNNYNDGCLKWSVYGGALDGETRHYRIMYSRSDTIEELEHTIKIKSKWKKDTQTFIKEVLHFLQLRDDDFIASAKDLLVMDPWLYACSEPQIEPVD